MYRLPLRVHFIVLITFYFTVTSGEQKKPNIITIVIDDLGWNDISYHNSLFPTPNIERMANEGIILNKFYTSSSCTPSRAAFMTGKYNIHTGLQDSLIHFTEPRGVPLSEVFISSKLQNVGYTTYAIGKWHLGMHSQQYLPLNRGFDYNYGIYTGGGSHTQHLSVSQSFTARGSDNSLVFSGYNLFDQGKVSEDNYGTVHSTYLYNTRAVKYIKSACEDTNPFFMYLAYQAVHDPIEVGNEEMITGTTCNDIEPNDYESSSVDWDNRKIFCGMVAEIDLGLGAIRSTLEELDEWENTLIFFFSDNGGNPAHGSSNYPFTGEKGQYWEGGVRVPAFVAGGYTAQKLAESNIDSYEYKSLVHVTDLHRTILSVAGYEGDDLDSLDGVDLWTSLVSTKEAVRTELLININSATFGGSGALIVGDYKLMKNADPKESSIYSKVRKELVYTTGDPWAKSTIDPIVDEILDEVLDDDDFYLFNINKNPNETTHEHCDDLESCTNLFKRDQYATILTDLETKWNEYASTMVESTFLWQDDGVLANPLWFSGVWTPWREINGASKAQYLGYSASAKKSGLFDVMLSWFGIDKSCSNPTNLQSKTTEKFNVFPSSIGTAGTLILYVGPIIVAAGIVGYKFGRRSGYYSLP